MSTNASMGTFVEEDFARKEVTMWLTHIKSISHFPQRSANQEHIVLKWYNILTKDNSICCFPYRSLKFFNTLRLSK